MASATSPIAAYRPLYDEHDYTVEDVEGALPAALRGTLYRNGPGKLDAGGRPLGHLFDGDGMLSVFTFGADGVRFRNRYIQTKHYRKSLVSRGAPCRGLGTMRRGGVLANALRFPTNVANTGVVMHAGRLLALWEGGKPTEIDPDTLDTVGSHDFDGELKWLGAFSAHPKWDATTGDMFNFGMSVVPKPGLSCYRVDPRGKLHHLGKLDLPAPMFNHDMGLTSRYVVFVIAPLVFPLNKTLGAGLGLCNFVEAIDYQAARGTMIGLVPRDGGKPRILYTDPLMHLHLANSYDDGADTVVELVNYQASWAELNGQLADIQNLTAETAMPYGGNPLRLRITPSGKVIHEQITDLTGDFPTFNLGSTARPNRYTYLAAGADGKGYPNALAKIDNVTGKEILYRLPHGQLAHEALFVPRPQATAEDDGWLLMPVQDGVNNIAALHVLNADDPESGPIYVGRLRHHLPLTFHGSFTRRSSDGAG